MKPQKEKPFAVIAGGGTAGHVEPALAIARAIEVHRGTGTVELIGSRRGLESRLLPGSGFSYVLLPGRGISRKFDPASLAANAGAVFGLIRAFFISICLIVRRRPSVLIAVGGYASAPPAIAAWLIGVPIVVVTVDAVPGAANRLLGRLAKANAVAYGGSPLPRSVLTGVPVRPKILEAALSLTGLEKTPEAVASARRTLGLPTDAMVISAFGGSLGATRINESILGLVESVGMASGEGNGLPPSAKAKPLAVYHVVGRRDFDWATKRANQIPAQDPDFLYKQVEYEENMDLLYLASDLVVCRAGAMTIAELAAMGLASILVPLPGAPGDHQTANANVLVQVGAALLISDGDLTATVLSKDVFELLADSGHLKKMGTAARSVARPDAADAIASLAEAYSSPSLSKANPISHTKGG